MTISREIARTVRRLLMVVALLIAGGSLPAQAQTIQDGEGFVRVMPIFVAQILGESGRVTGNAYLNLAMRVSSERMSNVVFDKRFRFQASFLKAMSGKKITKGVKKNDIDLIVVKRILLDAAWQVMGKDVILDLLITGVNIVGSS